MWSLLTHLVVCRYVSPLATAFVVTFVPRAPTNPPQNDDATRSHDLKRRACEIARASHAIEDEIRAMVSSYMAPNADEDQELAIGRLVSG